MATNGKCSYCLSSNSGNKMEKHLLSCKSRQDFFNGLEVTTSFKTTGNIIKKVNEVTYYLFKIFSPEYPEYWLYVDISEDLTLFNLDSFLRDTWLECCGHLSSFTINEETYESQIDKLTSKDSRSMRIKLKDLLLQKDMHIGYTYDYGDSTVLNIKVVKLQRVITTKDQNKLIKISARNDEVDYKCFNCNKEKATEICTICLYEKEGGRKQSSFCKSCAVKHECGEEMTLHVTNSPRSGICGYAG